jgi:hypothetical protein
MTAMFANWKTSLAGLGLLLTGGGHLLTALSHGDTSTVPVDSGMIMSGLGLLVAKDGAAKS